MRRGEIFGLKWSDVDFEERVLTIRAFNTKTMQERQVSLTTRLMIELERLWEESPKNKDFLVFGFTDNVKKSWTSVRTKAGLPVRAFQYATYFPNYRLADKERYVAIEKQPQRLAGRAVTVGDSLNEEITVKNDTGSKFRHRLFVTASLLADCVLGFVYEVVEFLF
jgi:integrase